MRNTSSTASGPTDFASIFWLLLNSTATKKWKLQSPLHATYFMKRKDEPYSKWKIPKVLFPRIELRNDSRIRQNVHTHFSALHGP